MGIKRAIALIINTNYHALSSHLGIDSAVSPKSSTVDSILKFIRKRNVSSVHSLFGGRAEVLELTIPSKSHLDGKLVKNLKMPENSLIIGITRNNKNYIPDGNFVINARDVVLTIAAKKVTHKIEQMFGK
jgi:trk system potassium uptake protein TrkA